MAKSVSTDVLDGALSVLKTSVTKMVVCSAQPLTFTDANTTMKLAEVTMVATDFTLAAGVTNGRRVTTGAKSAVPVLATGSATHVALVDVSGSRLLYVTTSSTQALTIGGTVNITAWDVEIANPV